MKTISIISLALLFAACSDQPKRSEETRVLLNDSVTRNEIYGTILMDSVYIREFTKQIAIHQEHLKTSDKHSLMKAVCMPPDTSQGKDSKMKKMMEKDSSCCKKMHAQKTTKEESSEKKEHVH